MKLHTVSIYINQNTRNKFLNGYVPGDGLDYAVTYVSEQEGQAACDEAFQLFNAPVEYLPSDRHDLVNRYHRQFPSLSVGDVVEVDKARYAVESVGWKELV